MSRAQKLVLNIGGILVAFLLFASGLRLLDHAFKSPETWEHGYPLTFIVGVIWAYIVPCIALTAIIFFAVKPKEQ